MSFVFKHLDLGDISTEESTIYKTQYLESGSQGIFSIQFRSGSLSGSSTTLPDLSGSYWQSLANIYYKSGSKPFYKSEHGMFYNNTLGYSDSNQHLNKFNTSGSLLSIPQKYFGEQIKPGSFSITDNSHPSGTITLRDDSRGNLYPVNNIVSASTNNPSASDNYVGNVFYDLGIATITETGSYSHTPSTASFNILTSVSHSNYVQITGSDLTTVVKFQLSAGSPADTSTVKYITSGSTKRATALNFINKINSVFESYITASIGNTVTSTAVTMSNFRGPNKPANTLKNLGPITGSSGIASIKGFGGGSLSINYTDVLGKAYTFSFDSTQTVYTKEYTVTLNPDEFNRTMNPTVRGFVSGGATQINDARFALADFTSSDWTPYITGIQLYQDTEVREFKVGHLRPPKITEPVIIAKFPKPIRKRNDATMIFKLRLDI